MKNPFEKNKDATDQSVWADWLSDDSSNHEKSATPHKQPAQRPHFPNTVPRFGNPPKAKPSAPSSNAASQGPKPLVIDPQRFQEQRMQAFLAKQPKADSKPPAPGRKEIALSISMPAISFSKLRQWHPSRTLIKRASIVAGVFVVVGLVLLTPKIIGGSNDKSVSKSSSGGAKSIPKSFAELKPAEAKNVSNERYDASRGFYSYNDKYKSGNMTVDEQPLPDNVRDNPEKGKQLAQSVGATADYETTNGTLYLNSSDKKTAQRAVLIHRQLLIFIQSTEPLGPTAWVDYVQSLN